LRVVARATIADVSVGFPEPTNADECRKASPVAVWHSSSFHGPRTALRAGREQAGRLRSVPL
jgi:hypothetical protein